MTYVSINEMLAKAEEENYAVGAFNIFDQLSMETVVQAAAEMSSPVIVQVLPPVVQRYGSENLAAWLRPLCDRFPEIPVALHLDHGKDLGMIEKCIEDQWSSVMIDASDQPMEENIKITKHVVNKANSAGVSVEGEIGSIFSVDESKDFREKSDHLATIESCLTYFQETGVDALAPAIGTAHGLYKDTPSLDFDRLAKISNALEIPVVIHGGTGLTGDDFKELIRQGSRKINIATQICLEYMEAIRDFTRKNPESSDPLSFFTCAEERIKTSVRQFIELFGSKGKA